MTQADRNALSAILLGFLLLLLQINPAPLPVPPGPAPVDPVVDPVPPEPTPVVTSQKLWLVAIDNPLKRLPSQTKLLSDVAYWDSQRAKGHDYEHYQAGSKDAQRYSEFAKFPASLIVQNFATGEVLGIEEIPAKPDTSWADSIIAKYSGAK